MNERVLSAIHASACFLSLSCTALGLCQDSIPSDVISAWETLPSKFVHGNVVSCTVEDIRANKVIWSEKVRRLEGNLLVESKFYDQPLRKIVRGPKYKFVIDEIDGAQNARSIVDIGEALPNEWDDHFDRAESWLNAPFQIYKIPFKEFFGKCSAVRVSGVGANELVVEFELSDEVGGAIWKDCTAFKGMAKFDALHDWRLSEFHYAFINPAGVPANLFWRLDYDESTLPDFVIEEGGDADGVSEVFNRTTVKDNEGSPSASEFLPETYGISVGSAVRWWQRPPVWFTLIALACFSMVAVVKYRAASAATRKTTRIPDDPR